MENGFTRAGFKILAQATMVFSVDSSSTSLYGSGEEALTTYIV